MPNIIIGFYGKFLKLFKGLNEKAEPFLTLLIPTLNSLNHFQGIIQFV